MTFYNNLSMVQWSNVILKRKVRKILQIYELGCVHFTECVLGEITANVRCSSAMSPCLRLFCSSTPACFDLLPFFHCDSGLSQQQEPPLAAHGHSVQEAETLKALRIETLFSEPLPRRGLIGEWCGFGTFCSVRERALDQSVSRYAFIHCFSES